MTSSWQTGKIQVGVSLIARLEHLKLLLEQTESELIRQLTERGEHGRDRTMGDADIRSPGSGG